MNQSQRIAQAKSNDDGIFYFAEIYFPQRNMNTKALQFIRHAFRRFEADVEAVEGCARVYQK
jgi:hypothetical protein